MFVLFLSRGPSLPCFVRLHILSNPKVATVSNPVRSCPAQSQQTIHSDPTSPWRPICRYLPVDRQWRRRSVSPLCPAVLCRAVRPWCGPVRPGAAPFPRRPRRDGRRDGRSIRLGSVLVRDGRIMTSSAVLLVTLLTAASGAGAVAAVAAGAGQRYPIDSLPRAASLQRSDRLVNSFQRSSGTDAAADRTGSAADVTGGEAADVHGSSERLPRVLRPSGGTVDVRLTNSSVGLKKEHVASQIHAVTPPNQESLRGEHASVSSGRSGAVNWPDAGEDDLIDLRFITISNNSTLLREAYTALAVIGKIVLTVLLLCLAVSVFFALGVIGNTSQVYNRYGHYDPYSPWGPYTANGAIDQPGYDGRALGTGEAGGGGGGLDTGETSVCTHTRT